MKSNRALLIILSLLISSIIIAGFSTDVAKITSQFWVNGVNVTSFFGFLNGSNQVTSSGIADNSIDEDKIIDNAIQNRHIEDMQVGWAEAALDLRDSIRIGYGGAASLAPDFLSVADTNEIKTFTGYTSVFLEKITSTKAVGAGWFVKKTSGYTPDGGNVFAASGGGYFVRLDWLSDNRTINVSWFGVIPDGTTNNAADLNKAIEVALATGANKVVFPDGTIKSNSELLINKTSAAEAITLSGAGPGNTNLDFSGANINGINVNRDNGTGYSDWVTIRDMKITGSGKATNTNIGVHVDSSTWAKVQNCWIAGFKYGVKMRQPNSAIIEQCYITSHVWGVWLEYNPNANAIRNCTISQCDSAAIYQKNGQTNTIYNLEAANNFYTIYADTAAKMTLVGGNIEQGLNGGVDVWVKGITAEVNLIQTRGLATSGRTNLFAKVQGSSILNMWECNADGYNTGVTGQHVYLANHTADLVTHITTKKTPLIRAYWATKATYFYPSEAPTVPGDVGITPNSTTRGHRYKKLIRDGFSNEEDKIVISRKMWNGGYGATSYGNIDHLFSTDGATFAETYGITYFEGYKVFSSDADSATDVTVTVDSLNKLYSATATVWDDATLGKSNMFVPVLLSFVESSSPGSGTLVFRVWHPFHRQGVSGLRLFYSISGRKYY